MGLEVRPAFGMCALVAATFAAACEVNLNSEGLTTRETRNFKITGQPEVVLDTFDGSIEIHSWDRDEVEVEIEKRAMEQSVIDAIKVHAEQRGNRVEVRVTGPAREFHMTIGRNMSPSARLRVALPRASRIQASSSDGTIRVADVDGTITLRTADGSVAATRVSGEISIHTDDGSIRVERAAGKLDLETGDGSIVLDAKPSTLRLKTGDGTIRAQIDSDSEMAADWDLSTEDGSVILTLPSSFNGELDAETRDGTVRATHPLLRGADLDRGGDDRDDRRERRRSLRTRMGEGGKSLRVRTGDGSIRIES
ncbi:MAG: DUF4097 family beta strand repeat-containing protein [Vicinamibacterales bacterium]